MTLRGSVAFVVGGLFIAGTPTVNALTEPCGQPALTTQNGFFTNYESIEYSAEGNLIYHFRIDPVFAGTGAPFRVQWLFFDDECNTSSTLGSSPQVSLPAGVTDWSMQLVSPTQLAIWDDQNNVAIATMTVPSYPRYTRILFRGTAPAAFTRMFESRRVRLYENGGEPPLFENAAEKPAPCTAMTAHGYLFDSYERAEYVDGLLRVHLRFKSPNNDGRPFFSQVTALGDQCTFNTPFVPGLNTHGFPPFMRYYSFRMISLTEWRLWNDEKDEPIVCTACSGTIPEDASYVTFFGSVDGGATQLRTTPFPPTIAVEPEVPDPVIIIPGILGSEKNSDGVWVIDPILHTYDDLIATLDVNHYTPGVDLFTLPYNWRKSNVETAVLLKEKIDEVKVICGCDKVDLVAHSMGGLVARQYIQSPEYDQDVDQLIFLGTPHLGAPKAYLMWEGGVTGFDWQDAPLNFILSQEAKEEGYSDALAYVRAAPISSVQQLLPVHDYIFDSSGLRDYPSNYPVNSFLEDLNSAVSELTGSGVQIHNFVGDTSVLGTIVGINTIETNEASPMWEHGEPDENEPFVIGIGDGTVTTPSALFLDENLVIKDVGHRILPTAAEGEIFEILTGNVPSVLINNPDIINLKLLFIKILSPADLLIEDPDGNKIGKENGQIVNEISNGFYTGFNTNTEFITIFNPLDGEYKVITEGTGTGAYIVEIAHISEQGVAEASFTGNTLPGLLTELDVPVSNENPESIEVIFSEDNEFSLNQLLALIKLEIEGLEVTEKIKKAFLKKIAGLEKKIENKKKENAKKLANFDNKVSKEAMKGKIATADAEEILGLLALLEAQALEDVTLDADVLAQLKTKIEGLDIKAGLKKDLLKRVARLENIRILTKALNGMTKDVSKKGEKGIFTDEDAQTLLDLLEQIESAI